MKTHSITKEIYQSYNNFRNNNIQKDAVWRKNQAHLPIEEKIKIVMELQKRRYEIATNLGRKTTKPWE